MAGLCLCKRCFCWVSFSYSCWLEWVDDGDGGGIKRRCRRLRWCRCWRKQQATNGVRGRRFFYDPWRTLLLPPYTIRVYILYYKTKTNIDGTWKCTWHDWKWKVSFHIFSHYYYNGEFDEEAKAKKKNQIKIIRRCRKKKKKKETFNVTHEFT